MGRMAAQIWCDCCLRTAPMLVVSVLVCPDEMIRIQEANMMNAKLGSVSLAGMILAFATIILPLCMEEPGHGQSRSFPRAEEVSRRWLTRHPRARDEAEKQIITVMDDMQDNQARGMGNVLPEDGRLMRMLTESLAAKHVVEIGTANGYSAMWFCLALRATGGRLTTHEIDPQRISLARENFQRAGVDQLVTLVEVMRMRPSRVCDHRSMSCCSMQRRKVSAIISRNYFRAFVRGD